MATPRSIRFDDRVIDRLTSFVARHPGLTASSVAARLVDEGLRMEEHPGVLFRDGPMGRRATVVGGPDVWEIVRAVRATRAAEPDLGQAAVMELVEENSGLPRRIVQTAIEYWSVYPDEVEASIAHTAEVERDRLDASGRADALLKQ